MATQKKTNSRVLLLLASMLASTYASSSVPAKHSRFQEAIQILQPKLVIQAGAFSATQGRKQHIDIIDAVGDDFTLNHHYESNAVLGAGLYINGQDFNPVSLLYGVNAFYFFNTQVNGKVVQEKLYTNLSYHYSISNLPIYLATKINLKHWPSEKVNLTFDLGIGPNIIRTSSFTEKSIDNGVTIPDYIYAGQSTVKFSGTFGAGLKINNFFGKSPLECGYKFFYLGQSSLKKVNTQVVNALKTGNNFANALLCSVEI